MSSHRIERTNIRYCLHPRIYVHQKSLHFTCNSLTMRQDDLQKDRQHHHCRFPRELHDRHCCCWRTRLDLMLLVLVVVVVVVEVCAICFPATNGKERTRRVNPQSKQMPDIRHQSSYREQRGRCWPRQGQKSAREIGRRVRWGTGASII